MDIQKIKLGKTVYDIKDLVSRTGFATASLVHNMTDPSVDSGNTQFSGIVFYGKEDKSEILGTVKLSQLAVPAISSQLISTTGIISSVYGLDNATAGIVDTSGVTIKLVNNKPVVSFTSTSTGTSSGTATEVQLPVGQSGTVALLSDVTNSASNKVGAGDKTVITPTGQDAGPSYTQLRFFVNGTDASYLFPINLDELYTQIMHSPTVDTSYVGFSTSASNAVNPQYSGLAIQKAPGASTVHYEFTVGSNTSDQVKVRLPMTEDGVIALTSDVEAVWNDVDDIKTLLNVDGTDVQGVIDKYDEIVKFLDGLEETPTLVTQLNDLAGDIEDCVKKTDIADNFTTNDATKVLSAKKGKELKDALDTLSGSVVKKISLNGEEISPSSGTVTLPNIVTKIQLNGKDQTLDTSGTGSVGKVNLNNIPTKIKFNGTDYTATPNSSTGEGLVTINESDPVFTASPAYGITATDLTNWRGGLADVQYTTSGSGNSLKHLLQKKAVGGSFRTFVELPTAVYIDTQAQPETLELILATAPSS